MRLLLITVGAFLLIAGLLWPWLVKLGLGHLPGDISFRGKHFSVYFPLMTCIIISAVISLLFWLLGR